MESFLEINNLPESHKTKVITSGRDQTVGIAFSLGLLLRAGDIICLDGDLGAGKTAFTYGIAQALGIRGVISSPTFTILIEHTKHEIHDIINEEIPSCKITDITQNLDINTNNKTDTKTNTKTNIIAENLFRKDKLPLYHFDAYRLSGADEFYDLGFDEYFSYNGVCVIEWAHKIYQAIPPSAIKITIQQGSNEISDQRTLIFSFPKGDCRAELFSKNISESGYPMNSE